MRTLSCQAILFDLDGTLVDSAERIRRLWQAWGQQHGVAWPTILEVMHGRRAAETIRSVAPHLQVEAEVVALETEEISDMEGVKAYAGVTELLGQLSPDQWAIVTSGSRQVAEARLQHVKLPIPGVLITGDDVRTGKPAPDGYWLAARQLQVKPTECVVMEDAPVGVQAGQAAGMRVVAVATTHSREELREADAIVPELAALELKVAGHEIRIQLRP